MPCVVQCAVGTASFTLCRRVNMMATLASSWVMWVIMMAMLGCSLGEVGEFAGEVDCSWLGDIGEYEGDVGE